jgi:archaellum component FlaC
MRHPYTILAAILVTLTAACFISLFENTENAKNIDSLTRAVEHIDMKTDTNDIGAGLISGNEKKDIATLQKQIETLNNALNSLITTVGGVPDKFTTINKKITSLQTRIKVLQRNHK